MNLGHLDERGVYTGAFSTFALCGFVRAQVNLFSELLADPIIIYCNLIFAVELLPLVDFFSCASVLCDRDFISLSILHCICEIRKHECGFVTMPFLKVF